MSDPRRDDHGPVAADVTAILAPLTRKGARLVEADGDYVVAGPGQAARRAGSRRYPAALVAAAVAKGWLLSEPPHGAIRLTETGMLVLRRGVERATDQPAPPLQVAVPPKALPLRKRVPTTSPLARLASKRDAAGGALLSRGQLEAGERLARDFQHGQMQPRITANWDRAALGTGIDGRQPSRSMDVSERVSAAQERARRALADAGPEFADLLIDVCCLEIGIEACEARRHWPPRSGRIVLGLALDRLVRHYGIVLSGPPERPCRTLGRQGLSTAR